MFEMTAKIENLLKLNAAFLEASDKFAQQDIDALSLEISEISLTLSPEERYYCFLINFCHYTGIDMVQADEDLTISFGHDIDDKLTGITEMLDFVETAPNPVFPGMDPVLN